MTEGSGEADPLNERAKPFRRWAVQSVGVVGLITIGVIAGAKLGQPVKRVEQKVTAPIREVVKRTSPIEELPNLVAATCPAIVGLHVAGGDILPPQGVLLSADGYIVTTAAFDPDATIEAWTNDGQKLTGKVKARDPLSGISLLKVDGEDLSPLALGDADLPEVGRWGVLVSSPAGRGCMMETATVASDFVTENSSDDYYVRIHGTGSLPPPGTPFVAPDGRLVAVSRPSADGGPSERFLSADILSTVVATLMRGTNTGPNPFGLIAEDAGANLSGRLGSDRGRGATIVVVARDSPAARAGLKVGDIILSANNMAVSSASELARSLGGEQPIPLVVSRAGEQSTLTLTLTPPKPAKAKR